MSWSTPKTDWNGETVDGVYTGDRFNAVDFNRIKNNLEYLRELAIKMYDEFAIQSVGSDKTVNQCTGSEPRYHQYPQSQEVLRHCSYLCRQW